MALWTFAGLAVPLLIHLLSHDRGRRLPFAGVRFIPGYKSRHLRSPSLSRWVLLLVRSLLLIALSLLMAQPLFRSEARLGGPVAVLVSPLALAAGGQGTLDLANEIAAQNGTEARILKPGFPTPAAGDVGVYPGGSWSLLAELEGRIASETAILVLIAEDPREFAARKPDFEHRVEFSVISGPAPSPPTEPLRLGLSASPERQEDLVYVAAALDALQSSGLALTHSSLEIVSMAGDHDVLIVLSGDHCIEPAQGQLVICDGGHFPLLPGSGDQTIIDYAGQAFDLQFSQSAGTGGEILLAGRNKKTIASLSRSGPGSLLSWNSRFNPEYAAVVGSWHFPNLLKDLVWKNRLIATVDDQQDKARSGHDVAGWLPGLLVLLLWLLERWLSGRRGSAKRHH
jgi:hypothetical protein